jgi:predicted NAD/FAD-dependent oxidoreductase
VRVAIVGAGIAGIACGRELKVQGFESVIFEKSRGVGGRVATRRVGEYTFDSGAQSIATGSSALTKVIQNELSVQDLWEIKPPIYTHESLHVSPGDRQRNLVPRFTYRGGNNRLAKLLAEGLDIRGQAQVDSLAQQGGKFVIAGEPFDGVVLTMPIPQTSLLLWSLGERRSTGPSRYRSCLSVLLGYALPAPTSSYHALIRTEGAHPLQWLGLESVKCPDRAPEGHSAMIAQLSGPFSLTAWDWPQERLIETVATYLARLYGSEWLRPEVSDVMKWKYSQPEMVMSFDSVNQPGTRLVLAGDGLGGGRIEHAYDSGIKAARHIVNSLS